MTAARRLLPLVAAVALAACADGGRGAADGLPERVLVPIAGGGEAAVEVEVAADASSRARGLMGRTDLPDGRGMLFVFDEEADHVFWMKDTPLPLDMIFVAPDGRIVGVVESAEPRTETPRRAGAPSRYVLEVPGGWTRRAGVDTGGRVRFD